MSNYLPEIENEFSRGRGRASRLNPLDWNLAQSWEDAGIPLRIVLAAMGDGFKRFHAVKQSGNINSLSYFTQEVEKKFAEWKTSQVGKSTDVRNEAIEVKNDMKDECFTAHRYFDHTDVLDNLVKGFTIKKNLPEPLASSVAETRRGLIQLIEEIEPKELSTDEIETSLRQLADNLTLPLITSVAESEREQMIAKINADYKVKLDNDSRAKILTRQLYEKFNLPQLTLFEL